MGLTQSKPISTDPKIINKPVWHVWTVKTSFLQVKSFQTAVKAGRARISTEFNWLIIKGPFQVSFSSHLNSANKSHVLRSARKSSDDSSIFARSLMCWICRITGTYSDVNEENVIQTCCTDNILRPKKSLKWPVSRFHLAHYISTECLFWKARELCWILSSRVVRLKTELIFFLKVLWKKLMKQEELTKFIISHP